MHKRPLARHRAGDRADGLAWPGAPTVTVIRFEHLGSACSQVWYS
jgi:hypothetical protein